MNLLMTLGHNSSVILADDSGRIVCGYEEERLVRSKSCSDFPIMAAKACLKYAEDRGLHEGGSFFVSHWYDDFSFMTSGFNSHQWMPAEFKRICDKYSLEPVSLTPQFTHHDAHAYSALSFFNSHVQEDVDSIHICVADGFGNREEVFSLYECNPHTNSVVLKRRIYGYHRSLGLLYQYATSFCGMKENQDEYKFLGYESWVHEVLETSQVSVLRELAEKMAQEYYFGLDRGPSENSTYVRVEALMDVKGTVAARLKNVVKTVTGKDDNQFQPKALRSIVGHFIQTVIESFYKLVINTHSIQNVIVTGGLHYNVKLNNSIMSSIPGLFCATPLAGDQGAAIGLMAYSGSVIGHKSLLWGHRNLTVAGAQNGHEFRNRSWYFTNEDDYETFVSESLLQGQIVNTVTGPMEFGPRALCNTSTLAMPLESTVGVINSLNGRDTVMPMAPVMLEDSAHEFYKIDNRIVGSLEYMITTLDYHSTVDVERFRGIMHPYPKQAGIRKVYSGRPQLIKRVSKRPIAKILENVRDGQRDDFTTANSYLPALINTSYNIHGQPIVFSVEHAIFDMNYNLCQAKEQCLPSPILVIGNF